MHFIVYKTTNTVNGRIYIGKHQTTDLDDGYLGSGTILTRAIRKYGKASFRKEVLFVFDNESDMNEKEAELVNEDFCLRSDTYNLAPGGKGGWGYVNLHGLGVRLNEQRSRDPSVQTKALQSSAESLRKLRSDDEWSDNVRRKISRSLKKNPSLGFKGKKHSDDTLSKLRKPKNEGQKNSQFGTMWITNGEKNAKIHKDGALPPGWRQGRTMNRKTRD